MIRITQGCYFCIVFGYGQEEHGVMMWMISPETASVLLKYGVVGFQKVGNPDNFQDHLSSQELHDRPNNDA